MSESIIDELGSSEIFVIYFKKNVYRAFINNDGRIYRRN